MWCVHSNGRAIFIILWEKILLFGKKTIWAALFVVPSLYALARLTEWPAPIVLSFILHWGLASAILVGTRPTRSETPDLGLRNRGRGFLIFAAVISTYCGVLILFFGSQPLAGWQYAQMHQLGRWGVIVIAISAGFCEELIYRGYMMTALKRTGHPVWLAMVLSSLSFVFFHGLMPVPFMVGGFMISMIWAALYQKTSILWVVIYIHGFWDATVLLIPWGGTS